jgi:sphinganine-1-phosphate aldolase
MLSAVLALFASQPLHGSVCSFVHSLLEQKDVALVLAMARPHWECLRDRINQFGSSYAVWQLIVLSVFATLFAVKLHAFLFKRDSLLTRIRRQFFRTLRTAPVIGALIQKEVDKSAMDVKRSLLTKVPGEKVITALPPNGTTQKQLLKDLKFLESMGHVDWRGGACSGAVYHGGDQLTEFLCTAYSRFALTNPLHPDVFPGVRRMEAEVVAMVIAMYHGEAPECCGTMTSGGTESIIMACKAYRDRARDRGIENPEFICPVSAHAAFDKAAQMLDIKMIHVPVDYKTRACNPRDVERAITRNTAFIVGSCPGFPHGIMDPIEELSFLAVRYNIGLHVDCCLGGFLVPFMEDAGFPIPPFDFRLKGVSSISCDTHKYGYAVKGTSTILYNSRRLRFFQYFVCPDWTGGVYASPLLAGSRPGGLIAATWAAMMHIGHSGYVEYTRKIIQTARYIAEEIKGMEGLALCGTPLVSVVAFESPIVDIYRLGGMLTERGWNLNSLQFPSSIHLCCTRLHTEEGVADRFLHDVRESLAEILLTPSTKASGSAAIYGMAQAIPDRSLVGELAGTFIDCLYEPQPLDE